MNVKRCQEICREMEDSLQALRFELTKDTPWPDYLLEKLRTLETDVPCLKEEFTNGKNMIAKLHKPC